GCYRGEAPACSESVRKTNRGARGPAILERQPRSNLPASVRQSGRFQHLAVRELVLTEVPRPMAGRRLVVDLGDVASKTATFGNDQRIGLDVAVDTPGRRNLHVAGGGHVSLVVPEDDRVHRLHVRVDDAPLANDQLAAHAQLTAHLALDLNRIRDLELSFDLGGLSVNGQQRDRRGGWSLGRRRLPSFLLAFEHRSLLQRASAAALCRSIRASEAGNGHGRNW